MVGGFLSLSASRLPVSMSSPWPDLDFGREQSYSFSPLGVAPPALVVPHLTDPDTDFGFGDESGRFDIGMPERVGAVAQHRW